MKRKRMRCVVSILLVLGLIMGIASSAFSAAKTLKIWILMDQLTDKPGRPFTWLYREFEREFGCKVEVSRIGEGFLKKLMAASLAGNPPDVSHQMDTMTRPLVGRRIIEPFPPDLQEEYVKIVEPIDVKQSMVEGKVWGVWYGLDVYGLFWNRDMYREAGLDPGKPPKTFKDFRTYAKKLTKYDDRGEIKRVGYAIRHVGHPHGIVHKMLWQIWGAGADLVVPRDTLTGGKAAFNNQAGITGVKLVYDMLHEDKSTAFGFPDPREALLRGLAAMQISETWSIAYRYTTEAPDLDWDFAPTPALVGNKPSPPVSGWMWTVPKGAKNKDLAWEWEKFLLRPTVDLFFYLNLYAHRLGFGQSPILKETWDNPWFSRNTYYKKIRDLADSYGQLYPWTVHLDEVFTIFGTNVLKSWNKQMSVEEALADAEKKINEILTQ